MIFLVLSVSALLSQFRPYSFSFLCPCLPVKAKEAYIQSGRAVCACVWICDGQQGRGVTCALDGTVSL